MEERINDLIENFNKYLTIFLERNQYSGPSVYFHKRIVELLERIPIDRLLNSLWFSEYLYAVLVAWGMHRMDGGAQLKDFIDFHNIITIFIQNLIPISHLSITELTNENISSIVNIFDNNSVMQTSPKLVGNTKALHHILPKAIPPVDNRNTLAFFNNPNFTEAQTFRFVINQYQHIINEINWDEVKDNSQMNTTRIKTVDNAIIGYRLSQNNLFKTSSSRLTVE